MRKRGSCFNFSAQIIGVSSLGGQWLQLRLLLLNLFSDGRKPRGTKQLSHLAFLQVGGDYEERMDLADVFANMAFSYCRSAESSWVRYPREGDLCRALLSEDGEWHNAVVKAVIGEKTGSSAGSTYTVTFVEYGKDQEVSKDEIYLVQQVSEDSDVDGCSDAKACELCERIMPLTRHHLLPRRAHAKLKKKGFSKEQLLSSTYICRRVCLSSEYGLPPATLASYPHTQIYINVVCMTVAAY